MTVYVFHRTGARADLLTALSATKASITVSGVFPVAWDQSEYGAVSQTILRLVSSTTATTETILQLDDVYRTQ